MLTTIRRLVLPSLACAALAAAAEPDSLALEAVVRSLTINQQINFNVDRPGRPPRSDSSCTIFVEIRIPESLRVVAGSAFQVTAVETDLGPLAIPASGPLRERMRMMSMNQRTEAREGVLHVNLQTPIPPAAAKRIRSLKIAGEVVVAAGKQRAIELAPLKDVLGKRMQIEGVQGGEIRVMRGDEDGDQPERMITLVWPAGTLDERIDRIEVRRADGTVIENRGGGSGRNDDRSYRSMYFERAPADDAAVQVILHGETATRPVSIEVKDIALPEAAPAQAEGGFDGKVKAREIEAPKAEAAQPIKLPDAGF